MKGRTDPTTFSCASFSPSMSSVLLLQQDPLPSPFPRLAPILHPPSPPPTISCHTGLEELTLQASEEWAALQSLAKPLQPNSLVCCMFVPYNFEMAVGKEL